MQIKLPFDSSKPISGQASIEIDKPAEAVFSFVAQNFFSNYPKWAADVVKVEPLTGESVFVGAKGRQVRDENGDLVESVFEVTEYEPCSKFIFHGIAAPYVHTYIIEDLAENSCKFTFRFDLCDIDIFMRPFEKLIRVAIEDGTENTVENIKNLLSCVLN